MSVKRVLCLRGCCDTYVGAECAPLGQRGARTLLEAGVSGHSVYTQMQAPTLCVQDPPSLLSWSQPLPVYTAQATQAAKQHNIPLSLQRQQLRSVHAL